MEPCENTKALAYLESKNIFAANRNGMIRIAFNIFNNFGDIDKLIGALIEFKKSNYTERS